MSAQVYLGDGAYASFDGFQVWIYCDVGGRTHSIALEAPALAALSEYVEAIKRGEVEPTEAPR
jgi:hypothetical protein